MWLSLPHIFVKNVNFFTGIIKKSKPANFFAVLTIYLTIFKENNLEIRITLHIFANEIKNEGFLNNLYNI